MPKTVATTGPKITLEFTLEEARAIYNTAERFAQESGNWYLVNALNGLQDFIRQNERNR